MKCPNCGSEIGDSKYCDACGTQVNDIHQGDQEQNKKGCPKCGSSNIQFRRENQGEVRGKKTKRVIHRTVGFCKDCGATWYPDSGADEAPKKRKTWLWVLGWLFIFPLPLTILMLRKKEMNSILKYGVIAVAWLIYLLIGFGVNSNKEADTTVPPSAENSIYADAEIVDLMSGAGNNKVGTVSISRAKQADCTEDALADWYFNYVQEHTDCNYHLVVYTDVPSKGVYSNGLNFIQKDVTLIEDDDGTYSTGDDAGSTYYDVFNDTQTIKFRATMIDESTIKEIQAKIDEVIPDDYKNGKQYEIQIAGPVDDLVDCSLTLVNESFSEADYQSIAEELATKIKELDLGIGYFNIAFQSDDSTMKAVSVMDDLSTGDVSGISTTVY